MRGKNNRKAITIYLVLATGNEVVVNNFCLGKKKQTNKNFGISKKIWKETWNFW